MDCDTDLPHDSEFRVITRTSGEKEISIESLMHIVGFNCIHSNAAFGLLWEYFFYIESEFQQQAAGIDCN